MKRKFIIIVVILLVLVLLGSLVMYVSYSPKPEIDLAEWPNYQEGRKLSIQNFDFVREDTSLLDIENKLGQPDRCGGSGRTICSYLLEDRTYVSIITTGKNRIDSMAWIKGKEEINLLNK